MLVTVLSPAASGGRYRGAPAVDLRAGWDLHVGWGLHVGWDLHVGFGLANPAPYSLMYGEPHPDASPPAAAADVLALQRPAGLVPGSRPGSGVNDTDDTGITC